MSLANTRQCCNPGLNGGGGWGVFNSLFGWTNSATVGSVVSYNLYWLTVIVGFLAMRYSEKRAGKNPTNVSGKDAHADEDDMELETTDAPAGKSSTAVREVSSAGSTSG